jgi:hypothetical protein
MCYMHDQPGWQKSVLRLLDVFVDGLLVQPNVDRNTASVPRRRDATARPKGKPGRTGSRKSRK